MDHPPKSIKSIVDEISEQLVAEFIAAARRHSALSPVVMEAARNAAFSKLNSLLSVLQGQYDAAARRFQTEHVRGQHMDVPGIVRSAIEQQRGKEN